jgi:oxygen-dependent protoporphyrinogen oxidase
MTRKKWPLKLKKKPGISPLVGSVYASDCEKLDLATGSPQLAAAAAASPSLVRGLLELKAQSNAPADAPVFYSVRGGMGRLIDALAEELGSRIRLNSPVGSLSEGELADADYTVLACPAYAAAPMLTDISAEAAELLARIDYASVTLVTLAYDLGAVPAGLDASGFLVPRDTGLTLTACSYASSKWAHLTQEQVILRASVGSHGADDAADLEDAALLTAVRSDLHTTMGISAAPSDTRISRWPRSFPQYEVGHLDRVDRIESLLNPYGIHLAGAAYRGIGIPACIRQGSEAVRQLVPATESHAR